MNQVIITIHASPSNYWAKMETEHRRKHHEKLIQKERRATLNSNTLQAFIDTLKALNYPCMLDLYIENDYLYGAIRNGWLKEWKKNDWKTAKGEPVRNQEQWKSLDTLMAPHSIRFLREKGV